MACPRCIGAVKTAIEKIKGHKAEIDLQTGTVKVTASKIDASAIATAVETCGFEFVGEAE